MKRCMLFLFLFLAASCSTGVDPYLKFEPDLPEAAIKQCVFENPSVKSHQCNVKHCLSNGITLRGMDEILKDVDDVLRSLHIRYWIEGGTAFGARRFQAFLPWDDDVDIDVVGLEFEPHLEEFRREIIRKGYRMLEWGGPFGKVTPQFWQIVFTKDKYRAHVLASDPDVSLQDAERMALEYELHDALPHLDIFPFDYIDGDTLQYRTFAFQHVAPQGYKRDVLLSPGKSPQPTIKILDRDYPVPNNLDEYLKLYIRSADASDVILQSPHSNVCSAKLRFRNIKQNKELLKYLSDYLKFVFGARFLGFAPDYKP